MVASINRRPLSPLIDMKNEVDTRDDAPAICEAVMDKTVIPRIETEDDEVPPNPRKSPEQVEFRARAASAGQQARAHVSLMVARFRNRSNTAEDKDKKRVRVVDKRVRLVVTLM